MNFLFVENVLFFLLTLGRIVDIISHRIGRKGNEALCRKKEDNHE